MCVFNTKLILLASSAMSVFPISAAHCAPSTVAAEAGLSAQDADSAESDSRINDIVVTARRTTERLQTVPVSVSAFDNDSLRERSITTPQNLMNSVPGIFLSGSGSRVNSQYSIRGQSKPVAGNGAAGVVTYFSEVPVQNYVSSTPQFDVSSIQVLKGPQGTLFGRNTTGGAVLITPAAPTFDFGGYVTAGYANYDTKRLETAINIPLLDDKLAIRLAGRLDRGDGTVKNTGIGSDLNNQYDTNFRASVLLQPVDMIRNTFIAEINDQPFSKAVGDAQILFQSSLPDLQEQVALQQKNGPYITRTDIAPHSGYRVTTFVNKTEWDFGSNVSLTNIIGHRKVSYKGVNNFDGSFGAYFNNSSQFHSTQWTEELQLRGRLIDDRLSWLVGAFYLDSKPSGVNGGVNSTAALGRAQGPFNYSFYSEKSKAAFANLSYDLSSLVEGLKISGGFRYTWDEYELCSGSGEAAPPESINSFTVQPDECASRLTSVAQLKGKSSAPTWQIGLDWQATRNLFLYAVARHGYRAGGLNGPSLGAGLSEFQTFKPETLTDVELGLKSDWNIGAVQVRLNMAAFHSKQKNQQRFGTQINTRLDQTPSGGSYCQGTPPSPVWIDGDCNFANDPTQTLLTINGGETILNGIEGELTVAPSRSFAVTVGGSLLDDKIHSLPPAILEKFFPAGNLLFTPKETLTANIRYSVPIKDDSEIVFNGNYYWSGKVNFVGLEAPSYSVANVRIDWKNVANSPFDISLYSTNVFKKVYITAQGSSSPASTSLLYGDPRTYGVEVRFRF